MSKPTTESCSNASDSNIKPVQNRTNSLDSKSANSLHNKSSKSGSPSSSPSVSPLQATRRLLAGYSARQFARPQSEVILRPHDKKRSFGNPFFSSASSGAGSTRRRQQNSGNSTAADLTIATILQQTEIKQSGMVVDSNNIDVFANQIQLKLQQEEDGLYKSMLERQQNQQQQHQHPPVQVIRALMYVYETVASH